MSSNNGELVHTFSEDGLNSSQRSWLEYMRRKTGNAELTYDEADTLQSEELDRSFEQGFAAGVILDAHRMAELKTAQSQTEIEEALKLYDLNH